MAIKAKHQETNFHVGDLCRVQQKIIESGKERFQNFEGVVISIRGRGENKSFTVRRIGTDRVGIEKIWALNSPWVQKITVIRTGKPRRAKLYYLRGRIGSQAIKVKQRETKKENKKISLPKSEPQKKTGK